jgi:hypothetical protein
VRQENIFEGEQPFFKLLLALENTIKPALKTRPQDQKEFVIAFLESYCKHPRASKKEEAAQFIHSARNAPDINAFVKDYWDTQFSKEAKAAPQGSLYISVFQLLVEYPYADLLPSTHLNPEAGLQIGSNCR